MAWRRVKIERVARTVWYAEEGALEVVVSTSWRQSVTLEWAMSNHRVDKRVGSPANWKNEENKQNQNEKLNEYYIIK